MKNSQSGQVGFLIVLLVSALLIVAGSLIVTNTSRVQEAARDAEATRILNAAEGGTDFIINNVEEGGLALNADQLQTINDGFSYRTDRGVVFPLPAGTTIELDPSKNAECQNESCVIGIWWYNYEDQPIPGDNAGWEQQCNREAALLVSEYSKDLGDNNQKPDYCNRYLGDSAASQAFYESCLMDLNSSTDARTGLSRERSRYYLFRPFSCAAAANGGGRDWAGYETAFGNTAFHQNVGLDQPSIIGPRQNSLVLVGGNYQDQSDKAVAGTIGTGDKSRQEFRFDNNLSKQFANYYEIPVWPNTTIVRIKALYADTQIMIDLPGQIESGVSTFTDGDRTTRSVEVKKTLPSVPSVMDYALFVGGGSIEKRAITDRDTLP